MTVTRIEVQAENIGMKLYPRGTYFLEEEFGLVVLTQISRDEYCLVCLELGNRMYDPAFMTPVEKNMFRHSDIEDVLAAGRELRHIDKVEIFAK
jgi:hypothetical protein